MPRGRKKKIRIQCFLPYNIIKLEREDRCYYHPTGIDGVKKKKKVLYKTFPVNHSLCKHFSHILCSFHVNGDQCSQSWYVLQQQVLPRKGGTYCVVKPNNRQFIHLALTVLTFRMSSCFGSWHAATPREKHHTPMSLISHSSASYPPFSCTLFLYCSGSTSSNSFTIVRIIP